MGTLPLRAQVADCTQSVGGTVLDEHDDEALLGATVYLLSAGKGAVAQTDGSFLIWGLCPGRDTLRVTHVGCEPAFVPVEIGAASAKTVDVKLEHHTELLDGIEVHAHRNETSTSDIGATLSGEQLDRTAGADFADVVEALPGVRQLATGANVGRPLVDGLGGSRLVVVQGGMPLASQDWGDEHALEIDPFAAANVQLSRTGGTVRYGASNTGGTLLLDDPDIPKSEDVTGQALLSGATNNGAVGGGVSVAQRLGPRLGYRAMLSGNVAGDSRAPDYVLSNTGVRRGSGHARLYYEDATLKFDAGYRGFVQESGILRAAHIGNLTDLERALASDEPLVIEPFTYRIDAPRQASAHHWFNANMEYSLARKSAVRMSYSAQLNQRQEYDIRRGGRSAIPSLDLELTTHDIRTEYVHPQWGAWRGSLGLHAQTSSNRNNPGTGTRNFIPYYDAQTTSIFWDERRVGETWSIDASGRLDGRVTTAQWWVRDSEGADVRQHWSQTDLTGSLAIGAARFSENGSSFRARLAYGSRVPNPAERFADGVHHALAQIEVGDTSLRVEHSVKAVVGYGFEKDNGLAVHVSGFAQVFDGFIYQRFRERPALTIRGAFPVVLYDQGDAVLAGLDLDAHAPVGPLTLDVELSYLRGQLLEGAPLPDIAPWRGATELSYSESLRGRLKDYRVGIGLRHIGEQTRVPDVLPSPPPAAFTLVDLNASGHVAVGEQTLGVHLTVRNLFDVAYRDYMDRLRFYADRPGRDVQLRLLYDF